MNHTEYMRQWREKNPKKEKAIQGRRQAKDKRKNIIKQIHFSRNPKGIEAEIMRHHAKGRSIADIIVWMNLPASEIAAVIQKHSQPTTP